MRIATNEELVLINGSSQRLSKNQLKKLYDHGGVLTPKDWATMIDNVSQDEIPIIYTNDELYQLLKDNKLKAGNIYYTEYYGELRIPVVNKSDTIAIIGIVAESSNKFGRGFFISNKNFTFNIDFLYFETGYSNATNAVYGTCKVKYTKNSEFDNESIEKDCKALLFTSLLYDEWGDSYNKSNIIIYDSDIEDNYLTHISDSEGMYGAIAPISQTMVDDYENNIFINTRISTLYTDIYSGPEGEFNRSIEVVMDEPDFINYAIQLTNICDHMNNRMDYDYSNSYSINPKYSEGEAGNYFPNYKIDCLNNTCTNNTIIGICDIILGHHSNNNYIEDSIALLGTFCSNNYIINSSVQHAILGYKDNGQESYLQNCKFINVNNTAVYIYDATDFTPDVAISSLQNINNIEFRDISNFSYFNCVRPKASPLITITETKEITTMAPGDIEVTYTIAKLP